MKISFYNLRLDFLDEKSALSLISKCFSGISCKTLLFVNAHCFNIAQKDKKYQEIIQQADLAFNDGIGIKIAGKIAGINFPVNLNGTDLIPKIIENGVNENKTFYLIGSTISIVQKAKNNLEVIYPKIQIRGLHDGFFSIDNENEIVQEINRLGVDIIIVGMGVPRQEHWIQRNQHLFVSTRLIIAGGAIIDFISGEIKRAPMWMRKLNLEWVYRLLIEPKRMWKRYLSGNIIFFFHLIRLSMARKKNYGKH